MDLVDKELFAIKSISSRGQYPMNKPILTMHPAADEINSEDVDMVLCNKRRYTFYSDDEKIKLFHLGFSKCVSAKQLGIHV